MAVIQTELHYNPNFIDDLLKDEKAVVLESTFGNCQNVHLIAFESKLVVAIDRNNYPYAVDNTVYEGGSINDFDWLLTLYKKVAQQTIEKQLHLISEKYLT